RPERRGEVLGVTAGETALHGSELWNRMPIATIYPTKEEIMEKTIIEVNGVKLEVDLRTAKRVDELRVGDRVKVLTKDYRGEYEVHAGTIVGFEPFENLPTVIVAYLKRDY